MRNLRKRRTKLLQSCRSEFLLGGMLLVLTLSGAAQDKAQKQAPATAPQVQAVLPSYEGQNVVSVEIAGRPDLDQQKLQSILAQRPGEPFSQSKVAQSIATLKSSAQVESAQVKEVRLEIRPQADGIRVLLVCEPAIYFGIFDFP